MADYTTEIGSPLSVTLVYAVVSGAWILVSDRVVAATVEDPALTTTIQTAKGWLFVAGSALLVFGLVRHGRRSLEQTNERLDRALQQTSVLHRILRHNLRNSCNVISGNTELVAAHVDEGDEHDAESEKCLETIRKQTDQLVSITEKTRLLRDIVLDEQPERPIDLAELVANRVDVARSRFPSASFETDLPDGLTAETDPRLGTALDELLENAVEHSDREAVTVQVALRKRVDGTVVLDVTDDGPGIPEVEQAVLEEGMESPMFHSEGLGLWIARTTVVQTDGTIRILANEPRGTIARIVLPS